MTISNPAEFHETADAFMRAKTPTPQLVHAFAASFAQVVANGCKDKVAVILPGNVKVERTQK